MPKKNFAVNKNRRTYVRFCQNPFRERAAVSQEFDALMSNPRVMHLGFYKPDVLVVATDKIVITLDQSYLIGEFLIFIIRRPVGRYYEVNFRFWNVTHSICAGGGDLFIHPHIATKKDSVLDIPNGELCIAEGQYPIYQSIRKGEVSTAVTKLIRILELPKSGRPFLDADAWPVFEGERHA